MDDVTPSLEVADLPVARPTSTLQFACKCGSDSFRVHVNTYADGTWREEKACVSCGSYLVVTEPILNGPH